MKKILTAGASWCRQTQIEIIHLQNIEFSIIARMFSSKDFFEKVSNQLHSADFTFIVTQEIFKYLVFYANKNQFFGDDSQKQKIAMDIANIYNIHPASTLRILNSKELATDIVEILDFSKKRQEIFSQNKEDKKLQGILKIVDKYGEYVGIYYNGMIQTIQTSYIFHLPEEFCDTFEYTVQNFIPLIKNEECKLTMELNEDCDEDFTYEDVEAIVLTKDITQIIQMENVMKWADKNSINHIKIPRNRGKMLEYCVMEDLEECNIKDIPEELFEIKKGYLMLNLSNNKIKVIPENISNIRCLLLMFCDNQIESLPKGLFEVRDLGTLCLHGNKLVELSEDINKLQQLKYLSISNNPIKQLPKSISRIATLKEIAIENTLIDENSLEFLHLENFEKISFDDRLLPYFLKNFHRLINIDTINLSHSEYKENDEMVKLFGINIDNETWMEDKDYQGHGCVLINKKSY